MLSITHLSILAYNFKLAVCLNACYENISRNGEVNITRPKDVSEMKKIPIIFLLIILLNGCTNSVNISSVIYHGPSHEQREKIIVVPINEFQKSSLEFVAVGEYLENKLLYNGYIPTKNVNESKYAAIINYGIDDGTTNFSMEPVFGQIGGGTSYTSGKVNSYGGSATYNATTTTSPTFGVVGAVPVSSTTYKRNVNIDIFKIDANKIDVEPVKVYEMKAVSSGSCGNINSVLFKIIDGMFLNFPGENGVTKNISVIWDGNC